MEENGPKPPEFLKKYLDELHKVYNESDKYHEIGFVGMLKKFAEDDLKSCYYFNKRIKFHYLSRSVLKHYNYDNQLIEQASCSSTCYLP